MKILRTPDEAFTNLQDYPFKPNYVELNDLRIHYVDEGPHDGNVVLMLHGEPSWSYLYRKMIPIFVEAGYRALAPDLVGFGRSDKPAEKAAYSYQAHVDWMRHWLEAVDLNNITLFCQDWGSLIGLRLVAEHSDRFARVVLGNGFLPTGDERVPKAFKAWQEFSQTTPVFDVGAIIDMGTVSSLTPEVKAGYDAPYPDESFKTAARMFPTLVPITPDDPASEPNRAAWKKLEQFEKPFLTTFSNKDPITRRGNVPFEERVPGAKGQPHKIIEDAGHFLQEEKGEEIAEYVVGWMKAGNS